jgi:N-acetylmuramoyl-L-alanine amidase
MMKLNSAGLDVARLQLQLRSLKLYSGFIDCFFDETIKQAVISFQSKYNLDSDGIVGPKTQTVLNTLTNNDYQVLFLHCAASPEGREHTGADIVAMHTLPVAKGGRGWSRPGYSDVIRLNGKIDNIWKHDSDSDIKEWEVTFGVLGSILLNRNARHVCYIGGMDKEMKKPKDTRTTAQKLSMYDYIHEQIRLNPNIVIAGHNQVQLKACPSFDVTNYLISIGVSAYNILHTSEKYRI